jgi:hypothetical protein
MQYSPYGLDTSYAFWISACTSYAFWISACARTSSKLHHLLRPAWRDQAQRLVARITQISAWRDRRSRHDKRRA